MKLHHGSVVEYLYMSTGKMEGLDRQELPVRVSQASFDIGPPPATLRATAASTSGRPDHLRRLDKLRKGIMRHSPDYRDPEVEVNSWIHFEQEMHWATMHQDRGSEGEDRVAVFTTCYPQPEGATKLILLGSTCHLLDRIGSVGRMGSTSDTLYKLVDNPGLVDAQRNELPRSAVEAAVHLDRILTTEAPRWQYGRLEGLAKAMHVTTNEYLTRIVIATPLYVRIYAPRSLRSRRAASKRRRYIEENGVAFIPGRR